MTKRRILPLVWLTFSGGGVIAAVFLPVLVLLVAFALPLGWITVPSHDHLESVLGNPLTKLVLIGLFVPLLVHAAHRFRYTLYDGLQVKARGLVAFACYGGATVLAVWMLSVVLSV
jgi:fumarate reductase subunit D